ncbi:MAG TPA: hypothetical protein O0X27_02840 [Methanocorpusculum sp.]|nr:hypothetical protein [Methanocorpusculum sp.]
MQLKKLTVIGALALVVIGCVVVAGCTSASTGTGSDNQIIGTWIRSDSGSAFVIGDNYTGAYYTCDNDSGTWAEAVGMHWAKNADGTYSLDVDASTKTIVTLDPVKGQFTADSGGVFTKMVSDASGAVNLTHYREFLGKLK